MKKTKANKANDYKRLCGEVWDALGVPPEQQEGEPIKRINAIMAAANKVTKTYTGKDMPGWRPMDLRNAIVELAVLVRDADPILRA